MATTAVSNLEFVERMYTAFNEGDIDTVLAGMAEDVTWVEPESEPTSPGTHRGPEAVLQEVFAPVPEEYEEFSATPERFIDGGDTIVVEGRFVGKTKTGASFDIPFAHLCDVKDGKLQAFRNHADTALMHEAFEN